MAHHLESQWMGKMQFNALVNGHTIVMDGPEKVGGENNGPIPKPFVLVALSGCTGMDVVSMLRKSKKEVKDFFISVDGEISKSHPLNILQFISFIISPETPISRKMHLPLLPILKKNFVALVIC